ncbi:MAG: hypothetical protein EOO68_15985 [Moraxellaceae bacterium]|nr:MAG: hypothetical protein EOO68_15985 [Moraxellaceae bacterium]
MRYIVVIALAGAFYYMWTVAHFPKTDLSGVYVAESCKTQSLGLILDEESSLPCLFEIKKSANGYEMVFSGNVGQNTGLNLSSKWATRKFEHSIYVAHESSPLFIVMSAKKGEVVLKNRHTDTIFHQYPTYNNIIDNNLVTAISTWRGRLHGHWKVANWKLTDANLELYIAPMGCCEYFQGRDTGDYLFVNRYKNTHMINKYIITNEYTIKRLLEGILTIEGERVPFQAEFSKDGNTVEIVEFPTKNNRREYTLKRISACFNPNLKSQACAEE